jgi:hypothetical protein
MEMRQETYTEILQQLKELMGSQKEPGFYTISTTSRPVISDVELKIRKEVMALLSELPTLYSYDDRITKITAIQDRLNLLWGD